VTVAKIGNLTKTEYSFSKWNTKSDATGTPYDEDDEFNMGQSDVNLYAIWIPLPPTAPSTPTLTAGDAFISVEWPIVSRATSYEVYYNSTNNTNTATKVSASISGTSMKIAELSNNTEYFVWVSSVNAGGTSPLSPGASATPFASFLSLGSTSLPIYMYNGKNIYNVISAQPSSKPQGTGTPPNYYSYSIVTTAGTSASQSAEQSTTSDSLPLISTQNPIIPYTTEQTDLDQKMRLKEQEYLASGAKQIYRAKTMTEAAAPAPISIGSTWNSVYISPTSNYISTTCRYISEHAYFFIDNRNISIMEPLLSGYGTAFDKIYLINHTHFGSENDTDSNGKIIIIFTQEVQAAGYLGYFSSGDKYPKTIYSLSNEGDIFYISTDPAYQGPVLNGTLAHEFQHMIYFDEHYNRNASNTHAWLNEALSQAAEFYNGYTANHEAWISNFLYSGWSTNLSLTYWTSSNYGYGAIFIRYLIDQYGDVAIKNMCSTNLIGIQAVETSTGADFNTIFNNFSRALLISGTGDSIDPVCNFNTLDLHTVQPYDRGGLRIPSSINSGDSVNANVYPYSIHAINWLGSFGTMKITGTSIFSSVFGLTK